MANLLDKIKKSYQSAKADYAQLAEGYPNAKKFLEAVGKQVNRHIPSNEDFHDPEAMNEWSQAAAMNAPMMGSIKWEGEMPWDAVKAKNVQQAFRDEAMVNPYKGTLRRAFIGVGKPAEGNLEATHMRGDKMDSSPMQDRNKRLIMATIIERMKK